MSCLSTEILYSAPEGLFEELAAQVDEETLSGWVEYILMVGRAFESALRSGELDDL